ncbi:MAG TPA: FAD-dependent oxidoreductase [Jatrophihabitans sp.]|uniref:FAD-dependent oxidoreductase n=1 Tax=Jatrophihabitans sp. TaxID=1932789 RepID=UPI002E0482D8|nr:FAD-dependent oxidoreductase [Jatrophihabitans sp.]
MAADDPVVIVGAGLMGAASAWALARQGRPVVVLEQYTAGHDRGSSHGSARIVRRAYGDELYTRLTGQAFELWRELENVSQTPLLRMLGGLDFGPERHVPTVAEHLRTNGVPHEVLPAIEAERRWPGMRFSGDVIFHPEAGTVDSAAAVETMLAEAEKHGALVRRSTAVQAIRPGDGHADVVCADGSTLRGSTVVAAAGAWVSSLVGGLVDLPALRVTRQQVFHFPRLDPAAPPWPSVIHEEVRPIYHLAGGRDGGSEDDRKIAEHDGGVVAEAGTTGPVLDESRDRVVAYVREWLPGLDPTPRREATCLYTQTPSEDFLLDRAGSLVVCSPCSGHGAKFAPLIGELVASLVTGSGVGVPERFSLASHNSGRVGNVSF